MPNIEITEMPRDINEMQRKSYDYSYPDNLDLHPNSKLHKKIKDYVMQRARISHGFMQNFFDRWNELDRVLTAYVDLTDKEKEVQENDSRKPVSIVVPQSYAMLETTLGYMASAFLGGPVFRYNGVSPNDTIGAMMLTKVNDLHVNKTGVALNLHTMWRDNFVYSFGAVAPGWTRKYGSRARKVPKRSWWSKKVIGFDKEVEEDALLFEGNKLTNIDPYTALPDPNYPIHEVKEMEFFGWTDRTNVYSLLNEEKHDDDVFNVKYVKALGNRTSSLHKDNSSRSDRVMGTTKQRDDSYTKPVDVVNMFVRLIPSEHNIGDSDYPEIWFVRIAADEVIIELRPLGTYLDEIPIEVCCSEYDGYNVSPVSRLEVIYGMQHTADWMFSSHIHNIRKALNDVLIVDPYLVNVPDLRDPGPGGIVRLRRPAWGRGVKDAVQQLGITDITQNNVRDVQLLFHLMEKVLGTDSSVMGALRGGGPERLTGQEFQGTRMGALNRLERVAMIISLQAMHGISTQFASNTQQLMEQETYIDVFGEFQEILMREFGVTDPQSQKIKVSPYDLLIDYEVKCQDGSVPGGNASASALARLFEIVVKEPELRQTFDIVRIFKHIAREDGAKNVENFVKIKTAPDEQIMNDVDKGNVIPLPEAGIQ